jgi:hypothetical protein
MRFPANHRWETNPMKKILSALVAIAFVVPILGADKAADKPTTAVMAEVKPAAKTEASKAIGRPYDAPAPGNAGAGKAPKAPKAPNAAASKSASPGAAVSADAPAAKPAAASATKTAAPVAAPVAK